MRINYKCLKSHNSVFRQCFSTLYVRKNNSHNYKRSSFIIVMSLIKWSLAFLRWFHIKIQVNSYNSNKQTVPESSAAKCASTRTYVLVVCVCVRWRRVCEAQSCVRRARLVIQRNPPPETRGSEGDSNRYKASANICPEQCEADENISSELTRTSSIYFMSLGFIIWRLRSRVQPGRRIFRECDSTANNILELTNNRQYSGWVRFFLFLTFSANWTHFAVWLHWCPCYWLDNMHAPTFYILFQAIVI